MIKNPYFYGEMMTTATKGILNSNVAGSEIPIGNVTLAAV